MTITIASQIAQLRQSIATVIKGKDEAIGWPSSRCWPAGIC